MSMFRYRRVSDARAYDQTNIRFLSLNLHANVWNFRLSNYMGVRCVAAFARCPKP